jgi:cell division transport system permease protein
MIRRLLYYAAKAVASVRDSPGMSLLTSATIAAALLIAGLYVMALQNLEGLALVWGRTATMTAIVNDAVPAAERPGLAARLQAKQGVERTVVVTPLEALERFKSRGSAAAALVEGVSEDVLPAVIEVHLRGGFTDLQNVERLAGEIRAIPGLVDVDYGKQEFERLAALLELLRIGGLIAGLLVAAATAFIISNTIRLTVFARRDEIIILRLVGATAWFVRMPFLIEGALWGIAGGGIAAAGLWLSDLLLAPRLSVAIADVVGGLDLHLFMPEVALGLLAAGMVVGIAGSALAVGRFLDVEMV